ncbi:MAG TPA: hypothetical protein VFR70_04475 [Flavobacterium sp.]|nr:hypothetical protein [Flavobacterium sp.]
MIKTNVGAFSRKPISNTAIGETAAVMFLETASDIQAGQNNKLFKALRFVKSRR